MAGLWDRWIVLGETVETFTIITTTPNELVSPVHDRMPVILTPDVAEQWLERPDAGFLRPIEDEFLIRIPASVESLQVKSVQTELKF
jgi:putative SOS response-associated peptidase YedK